MANRDDKRSLVILLFVSVLGLVARVVAAPDRPPGEISYAVSPEARPVRDSVVAGARRRSRPLGAGEKINVDLATAGELVRLPRVGPELARRMVRYRETQGAFGRLERVGEVPGIGPVVLRAIGPYVAFEPGSVPVERVRRPLRVSLNTAGVEELSQLPGIGPVRARAIVEFRRQHGGFGSIEDLKRVPGIGQVTARRIENLVRVP